MKEKTIHDGLINRRSIRNFSDRAVSRDIIEAIVRDAQWTPSWANAQPWKLYVATGQTAQDIRKAYQSGRLAAKSEMPSRQGENWGRKERDNMGTWGRQLQEFLGAEGYKFSAGQQELFQAPAIAYITIHARAPLWELFDAGAFEQSLLLSAYNHGVDTMVAVAYVSHPDYLREKLGIPDDEMIVMGIGLGYRSDDRINQFKSEREPLQQMLVIKD